MAIDDDEPELSRIVKVTLERLRRVKKSGGKPDHSVWISRGL